jgi:molecular chaperone DnaK
MDALSQSAMKMGEAIYKESQEQAQSGGAKTKNDEPSKEKENVVDADYEEVDDNDKNKKNTKKKK